MFSKRCTICNFVEPMACASCGSAWYCSKECQKKDWPLHKLLCKDYKAFPADNPRPSASSYLCILFPTEAKIPQLLWVERGKEREHMGPNTIAHSFIIDSNDRYRIQNNIVGMCRDDFFHDGSKQNICIDVTLKGHQKKDWRGPLIFSSRSTEGVQIIAPALDIKLADFRAIIVFFKTYGRGKDHIPKLEWKTGPDAYRAMLACSDITESDLPGIKDFKVKAVIMSCRGKLGSIDQFTETEIPILHPIFATNSTAFSQDLGVPLVMLQLPMPERDISHLSRLMNYGATLLNVIISPNSTLWGHVSEPHWEMDVGDCLVARHDREDITAHQVEAIVCFAYKIVQIMISDDMAALQAPSQTGLQIAKRHQKIFNALINKDRFDSFLEDLKKERVKGGTIQRVEAKVTMVPDPSWADVKSPFLH